MDQLTTFTACVMITFIVSIVGSLLPQLIKMNDKQTHLLISFSAGIFTGVLFLMFLPEAIEESIEGGYEAETIMYAVMGGFLALFVVDILLKHYIKPECDCESCIDHHSHDITSLSAFIGLAIHACFDGVALATAFVAGEEVGMMVLVAMCIHKLVVVFSLSSTFLMSNKKKQSMRYLIIFCLISPIAAFVSYFFLNGASIEWTGIALAISSGIFMFVTMCDMIPEAFHRKEYDLKSLALLMSGIVVVIAVVIFTTHFGGHTH